MATSAANKARVLIVGSGGVGTMAAYALEKGGKASVTAVLRSNYEVVKDQGFNINSLEHGEIKNWRPSSSKYYLSWIEYLYNPIQRETVCVCVPN